MYFNINRIMIDNFQDKDKGFTEIAASSDRVSLEDFHVVKVVGRGAYGKVYKAKFKRDE